MAVTRAHRHALLVSATAALLALPSAAHAQAAPPPDPNAPPQAVPPAPPPPPPGAPPQAVAPVAAPAPTPVPQQPQQPQQPVYVQQPAYGQPVYYPQQPVYAPQPYPQPVYAPQPYPQPVYAPQLQPVYPQQPVYAPQPVVVPTPITYAPNSVPPAQIRGYRSPPDVRAIVSGALLFGITYIPSFAVGAYCLDNTRCGRGLGWLYVPGWGPFVPPFFGGHAEWGITLLVLDGIAQSLGITAILVGALAPDAFGRSGRLVRGSPRGIRWAAIPTSPGADVGVSVAGAFF